MSRLSLIETKRMLEEATGKSVRRLIDIIDNGSEKGALEAAKIILARTIPEPKVNTAEVARQAALGASAGAGAGWGQLASKAQARLTTATDVADSEDATFTPLPRVQSDK